MPYTEQKVTSKHRWSENTFTFTTTRPPGFEFRNGEFVTLGLRPEGKLIPRAYSIVSTNQDEFLEQQISGKIQCWSFPHLQGR